MSVGDTQKSGNVEREQRIFKAARSLLLHYGYDKTTVSDIAREAGVSKGAVYLHFSSKDELVESLINHDLNVYGDEAMTALENDTDEWTFVGMYRITLVILEKYPLVQAMIKADSRIFGNLLQKKTFELLTYKRQSRYPLLKAMQDVGALRADVDMKTVAYILDCFGYGLLHAEEFTEAEDRPEIGEMIEVWGDFLQRALIPEDGGNPEAGRSVILNLVQAYRQQQQTPSTETIDNS